jgi:hypothetical protein
MYVTRYGRVSKPPVRYEPVENVTDDYTESEYDDTESDISSYVTVESCELTSESDADEYGNLDGFVVEENSEINNEEYTSEDGTCTSESRTTR